MTWHDRIENLNQRRVENQLWRTRTTIESPQASVVKVGGDSLLNFCSNDYLGLANHPALATAAVETIKKFGNGSGASHLICGHTVLHDQLESQLAEFVGAESVLVFSTGYMANLSVPQTFVDRHGLILQDKWNHASLLDAGQLSPARMKRYPHLEFAVAEKMLAESNAGQKLLMTDGVFSMDGDVAPVMELNKICEHQSALLLVDDAHGIGVMGENGGGCLQANSISISNHVLLMGTLGKAFGSFGAFVAGDRCLIDSLVQSGRSYIYTTALPPAVVGSTLAAIKLMTAESWRREKLAENVNSFRRLAEQANVQLTDSQTPIQPIMIGENQTALRMSEQLKANGIWVVAIRPPTVPEGTARLRVTLTAEHTIENIRQLVTALAESK